MENAEYWAKRFESLESENHAAAKMTAQQIADVYRQAEQACKKEIEAWYGRLAKNNSVDIVRAKEMLSRQELKEFKWDVEQYIKALEDNEVSGKWVKELENASARYHISKYEGLMVRLRQQVEFAAAKEDGILTDSLKQAYNENFYKTAYEIQSGLKTGFELSGVDENKLNAAIKRPWAVDGKNFSDRIWTRKDALINDLDTEITRNIMLGRGVQDSAQAIAKKFNTTANRAATLVYTESAAIASQAQKDMFEELGVEEYEIVATLNEATCEICQELDGKHFPRSEYKVGVTAHPFHPNCHCATAPYFDDEFSLGTRAARDPETGKTVSVPEDMTYPEWKKVFVDKTETMAEWKKQRKLPYIDITDNWYPDAVPNSHKIEDVYEYHAPDGNVYIVNNKNIKFNPSKREREVAELLEKMVGGPLKILPKITQPENVKTPDYIFNGETYDLKSPTGSSKSTCYSNVKAAKGQAKKVILDITKTTLTLNDVEKQIYDVYRSTHTAFVDKIAIIEEDIILKVYKRK